MSKLVINTYNKKSKINKEVYGNFSEHLGRCIYEGVFVGKDSPIPNVNGMRTDVVEALKKIKLPVLRWPGGCFADEYHWRDGIGSLESRKKMVNTHWGGVVEDNSFGTHEFMELCDQIGCEPYINGNVGSGTVAEMQEWVEYLTFDGVSPMAQLRAQNGREKPWNLKYFAVGNENWGCGGNMRPEYYADEYRRYQTYIRNFNGNHIYKIACGPNSGDYAWTETLMKNVEKRFMQGLSLHYYTVPGAWNAKGSATDFNEKDWYNTLKKTLYMEELVTRHSKIMDKYDPSKSVGLIVDEWGTWFDVEPGTLPGFLYQQSTIRDALVAGINLNIFNQHSDRVRMANIAQLTNVLQAVILTEGEKMVLTPTYHVFDMYKYHQDAYLLESFIENYETGIDDFKIPALSQSVSVSEDGTVNITLCNLTLEDTVTIDVETVGQDISTAEAYIVTGEMNAHNTFDNPDSVQSVTFEDFTIQNGAIRLNLPPASVVSIRARA